LVVSLCRVHNHFRRARYSELGVSHREELAGVLHDAAE